MESLWQSYNGPFVPLNKLDQAKVAQQPESSTDSTTTPTKKGIFGFGGIFGGSRKKHKHSKKSLKNKNKSSKKK